MPRRRSASSSSGSASTSASISALRHAPKFCPDQLRSARGISSEWRVLRGTFSGPLIQA
jgi:hypothetical protein